MSKCNVVVNVRTRPILVRREEEEGDSSVCIAVNGNTTSIWDPTDPSKKRSFTFDRSFNSISSTASEFACQEQIFKEVGLPSLDQALKGYNTTILAYGQTGSGKTYTMLGHESAPLTSKTRHPSSWGDDEMHAEVGLIPRFCVELFHRIGQQSSKDRTVSHKVEAVYYEIYNDRVFDLLDPERSQRAYRVREHPKHGPYVEGLQRCTVNGFHDIAKLLKRGAKDRHTAKTQMNDHSSRSHAVCELVLTCSKFDPQTGDLSDTISRMALVDLAGSERQRAAKTEGDRLREGAYINKGLLSLGNVIEALAANTEKRGQKRFVQYRDSTLTWLLREALGGNSRTVMLATLSPSALNYEESLSTLKYADRAKKIQNSVTVNRDSKKEIIFQLREEIKILKEEVERLRPFVPAGAPPDDCWSVSEISPRRVTRDELRLSREDPFLLQLDPLPILAEPLLYWIAGESTTYISSTEHTGQTAISFDDVCAVTPLERSDHTIVLSRARNVHPFHALVVRDGDTTVLYPTMGMPYDGRLIAPTARDSEESEPPSSTGQAEVLVEGLPAVGEEKLLSGQHLQIGEYTFVFIDPRNVSECMQYHLRCQRLERARQAQGRNLDVAMHKVQHIISSSGIDVTLLPNQEEMLQICGKEGDEVLVRTALGPMVYVWETESGTWRAADPQEAEIAAIRLVDQNRAEADKARRLTNILAGKVDFTALPLEKDLPSGDASCSTKLVRSNSCGLKVVQWDPIAQRWATASQPVAEMHARALAEEQEKLERIEVTSSLMQELREKVPDLDTAYKFIASCKAEAAEAKSSLEKQMKDHEVRETEFEEQLASRDKIMQSMKKTLTADKMAVQEKLDLLVEDYEQKLNQREVIVQTLEEALTQARYEWKKNETLYDTALSAKQKTIMANSNLKEALQNSNLEITQLRIELDGSRNEQEALQHRVRSLQESLAELQEIRHVAVNEELRQMEELLERKELIIQAMREEKERIEGNVKNLSQKFAASQEELKEQQSRLSDYREQLEAAQNKACEDRDAITHLTREVELRAKEKQELQKQLQALKDDTKLRAIEERRKQETDHLKQRLEVLEKECRLADTSRSYAEQAAKGEKQKVVDLQTRLKDMRQQYQTIKEALDLANERGDRSKQQLKETKEELNQTRMHLQVLKQSPNYVPASEGVRRDMDLSIQLEMVREENQKLQQKLADARMLFERSTESGKQASQKIQQLEQEVKKRTAKCDELTANLTSIQGRHDRLREANHRLQAEITHVKAQLRHYTDDPEKDPQPTGRKTTPYGIGFTVNASNNGSSTPRERKAAPVIGGHRKRSASNDIKSPSYARPTDSWIARREETHDIPPPPTTAPPAPRATSRDKTTPRKGRAKRAAQANAGASTTTSPPAATLVPVNSAPCLSSNRPHRVHSLTRSSSVTKTSGTQSICPQSSKGAPTET